MSGNSKYIPYLDGWRALAIIGVLIDHFITNRGLNPGRFGVEMFFVLSGFLMAEILFVRRTPLPDFFGRRAGRILPALFTFLIIMLIVGKLGWLEAISGPKFLTAMTLTLNYGILFWGYSLNIDHVWSLSVEEHSYIALGFVAFLTRRWRIAPMLLIAAMVVMCIINGWLCTRAGYDYYAVYLRSDVRAASILLGALSFMLLSKRKTHPFVPVALLVVALLLNVNKVPDSIKYSVGTILLASGLALLHNAPAWVTQALSLKPLRTIGQISFSLYLWQHPFANIDTGPAGKVLAFAGAAGCAVASYYLVETPCRKAFNRWIERRRKQRTLSASESDRVDTQVTTSA